MDSHTEKQLAGNPLRVVLVTAPDAASAERIARAVVEPGLAACANIIPGVLSIYQWEGKLEDSSELLLVIKTTEARFCDLEKAVLAVHPYSVPEIVAPPVTGAFAGYAAWVTEQTKPDR